MCQIMPIVQSTVHAVLRLRVEPTDYPYYRQPGAWHMCEQAIYIRATMATGIRQAKDTK